MPKKKAFDAKKLVKMVKDETHQQEIMKAFGFKTATQLKNLDHPSKHARQKNRDYFSLSNNKGSRLN